jgi:8-oxo-dGTP pyrophosphatase MutT (NUDIX family)
MKFEHNNALVIANHHSLSDKNTFCNNCGKNGHLYHQCKMPIMSIGVIAFRIVPDTRAIQYLMIRRKDTLGYMDFIRGQFPIYHKNYIINMIKQMTVSEKQKLYKRIEQVHTENCNNVQMKEKIHMLIKGVYLPNINESYDLFSLLQECDQYEVWTEPEWGFPKGRRNSQEKDYDCALREFSEETGYPSHLLNNIRNIVPFEEVFIGSNYKSYRHKYYLMYMDYNESLNVNENSFQKSEVSGMEWKTYETCMSDMRPYNLEKKKMLENIHNCLNSVAFLWNK